MIAKLSDGAMQKAPWEHGSGWARGPALSWVLKECKCAENLGAKQGKDLPGDPGSFLQLDILNYC